MKSIARDECLFLCAYIIYLSAALCDMTMFGTNAEIKLILRFVRYISYTLVCLKIFINEFYCKDLLKIIIAAGLVIVGFVFNKDKAYIFYTLLLIGAIGVQSKNLLNVTLICQTITLVVAFISCFLGIVPDHIYDETTRMRHSLGFSWTTTPAALYFFAMLIYVYLRKGKIKWFEFLIMELVDLWLYKMTDSRMNFFLSSFMLVFIMLYHLVNKMIFKYNIFCILPSLLCVFSVIIHWYYNPGNPIMNKLNDLLSGRLRLGKAAIEKYGIRLFGSKIEWVGFNAYGPQGEYNMVDNSYLQILLEHGFVLLILIILLYTALLYFAFKRGDIYMCLIVSFILAISVLETRLVSFAFNPMPFVAMTYIFYDFKNPGIILDKK